MKLAELQKKIADILGVSASQKELSFEIFVDKISEILLEHITLKVPRVGYFQLKATAPKNGIRQLIFSPLSEDFSHDSHNLYLTIDVAPKVKNTPEFDSNIFSIGVGKPLLPLSIDELPDTETSYAMLKKSIEERVKELLMETDQIPNFNIWDDYYKSPSKYEDGLIDETKYQLNELTSDLEFEYEIIPGKIPENISDNFNFNFDDTNRSSQIDFSNLFNEEKSQQEETEKFDNLLSVNEQEVDFGSGDILFPPEESPELEEILEITPTEGKTDLGSIVDITSDEKQIDFENTIEIISDEEDYSALMNLELNEISEDSTPISISDLLDDESPLLDEKQSIETEMANVEEDTLSIEEVMPKILADEKEEKKKSSAVDLTEQNKASSSDLDKINEVVTPSNLTEEDSLVADEQENKENESEITKDDLVESRESSFEELHKLSDEVITSRETEDDSFVEPQEEDDEKIEWNWGDELREEFGIPIVENEDEKFEVVHDREANKESDVEFVDDFLEDETVTKNLFSQLEKTLEREFSYDKEPNHRLTVEEKKPDPERNSLKKVVMEFSGPPAKYEFIEDRPSEKERRMAISLVNEGNLKTNKKFSDTDEDITERSKDSYFGKMFLIIFGAFVVVAAVVVFIIINGNSNNQANKGSGANQQEQTNLGNDSQNSATLNQSNSSSIDSTAIGYDDLNDFPRTATAPVPIKDATDRQILETIKNETAKLQSSRKVDETPAVKQSNAKLTNQNLPKTNATDTRVSNRIFYDGNNYFLQVSSWPSRGVAEEEIKRLRALGFNAFILEANLPQKGGTWYRVRIGPFKSETETNEFMKKNNL